MTSEQKGKMYNLGLSHHKKYDYETISTVLRDLALVKEIFDQKDDRSAGELLLAIAAKRPDLLDKMRGCGYLKYSKEDCEEVPDYCRWSGNECKIREADYNEGRKFSSSHRWQV